MCQTDLGLGIAFDRVPVAQYGMTPSGNDKNNEENGGISWRQALGTVGLAMAIPSMMIVPALFGWWIDRKFGTSPLWIIVGLVVGLAGTVIDVYRLLKRLGQFK